MSETNYDVTKRELLAVIFGLKAYRQYLLGRSFVISTDHSALQWLRRTPEPMGQLARCLTFIEQYRFEVTHRPGTKHGNADGLSRRPDAHQGARSAQRDTGDASQHSRIERDAPCGVLQVCTATS